MKHFAALLLAFNAFFGFNQLVASTDEKHLTYFWDGDEEELYLNINLANGLEFLNEYTTLKTKNGQGCEIVCKPNLAGTVFSSKGHELQEIIFAVVLSNIDNPNKVSYKITTKSFYKGTNEEGHLVSITSESVDTCVLKNPAIDLNQRPVFFTCDNSLNEGVISFMNSFPYSQIQ